MIKMIDWNMYQNYQNGEQEYLVDPLKWIFGILGRRIKMVDNDIWLNHSNG